MENSSIEWTDHTINFWWGCAKVSPGCKNCYADTLAKRFGKNIWGAGVPREDHRAGATKTAMKLNRQDFGAKLQYEIEFDQALRRGETPTHNPPQNPRVFCASMSDWLDDEVPIQWLSDLLYLIVKCPNLDFLLLTKRPQLWRARLEEVIKEQDCGAMVAALWLGGSPPQNVWIGTTVEDQARADERIPLLLNIPAKIRFLSCEPLLEAVNLGDYRHSSQGEWKMDGFHWVITGGESGHGCRSFNPDWARALRDQCASAGVAYFMKQMGGSKKPFAEIPEDLMIRQFPKS